jgi:hypothetical protein
MANKKIKIALSSTLDTKPVQIDIWFDNVKIYENTMVTNTSNTPQIVEHEFVDNINHQLKIVMENDYYVDNGDDLNLSIHYVQLSDENFVYPNYTYLAPSADMNLRTEDNSMLLTATLWGENEIFVLDFNTSSPTTYYDSYQYDLDNPPEE